MKKFIYVLAMIVMMTTTVFANHHNEPLVVADALVEIDENTFFEGVLKGNQTKGISYIIDTEPSLGEVVILDKKAGTYLYVPNDNTFGEDEFTFRSKKGKRTSEPGIVFITINQVVTPPPPAPVCGNNILEDDEECDDGNTFDGDGCSSVCTEETIPEPPTPEPEVADFYVAPDGSDTNSGTFESPFATVPHAVSMMVPGDLTYVRGGTYRPAEAFWFSNIDGEPGKLIKVFAYPNEKPIFDFSRDPDPKAGWVLYESDFWHIKGLSIYYTHDVGMTLRTNSSFNIIEGMEFAYNEENGFSIHSFASNNLILNNVSHHNYDPDRHGEDADGYVVGTNAIDNTLKGNVAYANSDDGFDLWESINTTLDGNIAYENGFDLWGEGDEFNGDGNGYKLGQGIGGHLLIRNIGYNNASTGATFNTASGPITLYNNTMVGHTNNYYFRNEANIMRNNISYNGNANLDSNTDDQYNSWNLGITEPKFLSMDPTSPDFLKLSLDSPAIDVGVDVGLSFSGSAPDLGFAETE